MALFGFGKKKEEQETTACTCGGSCTTKEITKEGSSNTANATYCVKVLGTGCKSCHELYKNVKTAISSIELPIEAEYITDMKKIMAYGVMSMPALVVNEKVISAGRVLKAADIEKLLHELCSCCR